MELVNNSPMEAGYSVAVEPSGRELLVVVVKGTFTLPLEGGVVGLTREQVPLIETDIFTRENGLGAPQYENDFAPRKPRCDVLLNGSAYAPRARPAERVTVALRVGSWRKVFNVVGNRQWMKTALSISVSRAQQFVSMPVSYENAFGGVDRGGDSEPDHYLLENHVGTGYYIKKSPKQLHGRLLPNTEEIGNPITKPDGPYRPMAFGAIGRAWKQRIQYAGTYDQAWLDNVCPFLPEDFRAEYYQAAPDDQWIDYIQGGEQVELVNLTPHGSTELTIPVMNVSVEFTRRSGERIDVEGVVDTLLFEPDLQRFTMNSRCTLALKRNIHELERAVIETRPLRPK